MNDDDDVDDDDDEDDDDEDDGVEDSPRVGTDFEWGHAKKDILKT